MPHPWTNRWSRAARLVTAAGCTALALGATAAARAEESPSCYSLALSALTGPQGADTALEIDAAGGCAPVETLKKVQLKIFEADGSLADVRNLTDVSAPDGRADIELGQLPRERGIEADVLVQTETPNRTYVLRGATTTRLRPDLVVAAVNAPPQTLTTRPIDVHAEIAEVNGDTAAAAQVTLSWGPSVIASASVTVPAGGRASVSFAAVSLPDPVPVELSVVVGEAAPAETDSGNNAREATVDVTEHELTRSRLILNALGGYGAQFNQHVFAPITSPPPGSLSDLEAKVKGLEPQLVRIFYNDNWEERLPGAPQNLASFIETVQLAHEAGATINITYQTAAVARFQPGPSMDRFAGVLEDLVEARGFTNVRWVTVQNEPNSTNVTLAQYNALFRALHDQLVARGLGEQIGLMGGDLVENGAGGNHRVWFQYMAANMNDILDAYSVHIYWNYWDIPRMEFRLRDVRKIVTEELPPEARKPTYITEFGVRGIQSIPGKPLLQPGYWEDGTQLSRTNLSAFQHLWFNVVATQLGFSGTAKWDAYWGKYDNGNQAFWMIGPASEGWPLFPTYHALRLMLQTTQRGWQVLGVDPWAEDDWTTGVADQPEKELAAYSGPGGEITLIGIDTGGRTLNAASDERRPYSVAGLPPSTTFNLGIWNLAANGENAVAEPVTTSPAGVARFEVPLHAAFALTTVPVS